jgi:alpha-methylacyl-CoA racemase
MLNSIRLLEVAALGPAPFCGMLFSDLGADVILVDRRSTDPERIGLNEGSVIDRGKRSIALDLKKPADVETFLRLVESVDVLVEGFRPDVMERLGLGPDVCLARNPKLVYGRATGWGQSGPMAPLAGHDMNYVALSGALWYGGEPGTRPTTPPSLVGDVGGGLYLALGLLVGVMRARETGKGCVVDGAIYDANAHMMGLLMALRQQGDLVDERNKSILDGSHWSRTYACACGNHISVQSFEPKFYRIFLDRLGLQDDPLFEQQFDSAQWGAQSARLEQLFATRTREEWSKVFEGSDACFAPVLNPTEAAAHPHNQARQAYVTVDGVLQGAPAPRFSFAEPWQPKPGPRRNQHEQEILASLDNAQR